MALYAKSLFAENYVVTSSVVSMSIAHASGSTIFGDTVDDSHTFTGNITASGNVSGSSTSTASFGYYQGITSFAGADGTEPLISGSAVSTASFGKLELPVVHGTLMRVGATQVAAGANLGDAGARYVFNVDHSAPYVGLGILAQSEFPHHMSILNKTFQGDGNFNNGITFNQDNDGGFHMYLPSAQVLIDVNGNMELKPSTPAAGEGGISGSQFSSASFGRFDAVDGFYEGGSKISDYVFEPDYELRSLDEVETFISQSKHLPGVPGQDDIDSWKNMSLGSKQTLFLEKIEELTLYTLQLHKRIKELEKP